MADELKISITATDGASKVFTAVERSATEMGQGIEEAAEKAGGEFQEMVRAAQQMSQALDRNAQATGDSMTALGRSIDRLAASMDAQLAAGAREAGTALNQVEQEAEQATSAINQAGDAGQRAGVNMQQLGQAGQTAGQGLALLGGAFALYAGQTRDHGLAVSALQRTYGDAAQSFIDFANTLQSSTIFSNDQVLDAANIMGTLKRNYELTDQQIQQLIRTSADLAAVNGTTLADAAQRVAAAIRGEAESAEMLGLTMNDASLGIDTLSTSVGNAERAQIRYTALLEQSTFATGAAGEQAQTTTGQVQQLANRVQDAAIGFVEWTGPIGQVAAGLSSFGLEAGLAVGGLARLAQGIREATVAAGGMGPVLRSLSASPAFGLTALAAGAGLAVIAVRDIARSFDDNYYQSISTAVEQTETLDAAVLQLIGTMNSATTALEFQGISDPINQTVEDLKGIQDELWELEQLRQDAMGAAGGFGNPNSPVAAQLAEQEAAIAALEAQYGDLIPAQQAAASAQEDLTAILRMTGAGAAEAQQHALELTQQYEAGNMSLPDYAFNLNWITENQASYATTALEATAATEAQTAAIETNTNAMLTNGNVVQDSIEDMHQWTEAQGMANQATGHSELIYQRIALAWNQSAEEMNALIAAADAWTNVVNDATKQNALLANQFDGLGVAINHTIIPLQDLLGLMTRWNEATGRVQQLNDEATEAADRHTEAIKHQADALYETSVAVESAERALAGLNDVTVESVQRGQDIWTAYNEALEAVADNLGAIADMDVLGDTSGTIIGQTRSWGQLSQSVADWSASLAHGLIAQTELDQAFLNGLISRTTYRDALEANHEIQVANAAIQEDLLRIQIKQMPVMAQAIQQQAEYIDGLADLGPEAQLAALGFMDQAQSMKALEVAQLAAAASTDAQQAATTAMIQEMAAADPVLAAMLEKMGLISIGADGTISVNFDEADEATVAIDNLTASIDALIVALGGIPPFKFDAGELEDLNRLINQEPPVIEPIMETGQVEDAALLIMTTVSALPFTPPPIDITALDNATDPATHAKGSIEDIPESWFTDIDAEDNASGPARAATLALNGIPRNVTTFITAVDNASFTAQNVANALDNLNGKTVTTYIQTVDLSLSGVSRRDGGMIPGYANGGMVAASLAEAGAELLKFRDGGQAIVPHPGIYMVEPGTSVLPAPATASTLARSGGSGGPINFYGPVSLYPASTNVHDAIYGEAIRRGR